MFKLLIADDEFIERDALKYIISKKCPEIEEVIEAVNGKEAIRKSIDLKPSIIILDIKMPGISGIEAAKEIKHFLPYSKILFLTAFDYFDYAREAIKIGVEDFIIKPAPDEQIAGTINIIVEQLRKEQIWMEKQKEIENKLGLISNYLEGELVTSLVNGDTDEQQAQEYFSVLGVEFSPCWGIEVLLDYTSYLGEIATNLQKNMIKKRCMEKLKYELNKIGFQCLINCNRDSIYILVFSSQKVEINESERFESEVVLICNTLYYQLGIRLKVGIGQLIDKIEQINLSFHQAKLSNLYRDQAYGVFSYVDDKAERKMIANLGEKEKQLYRSLIECDKKEAIKVIQEAIDLILYKYKTMEDLARKTYELLLVIERMICQEIKLDSKDKGQYYKKFEKCNSTGEMRNYVNLWVSELCRQIYDFKMEKSSPQIEKVCEYIKDNYSKEINLIEIAEKVGFSSFYLSKLFKEIMNMNFIDYVTNIRVEKAKALLSETDLNMREIGEKVGYQDPNYFTRVFKRVAGLTPTEYRNKKMLI